MRLAQWLGAVALTLVASAADADCPPASSIADYVYGGGLCLAVTTFGAEAAGLNPVLVVVVHGDISDGGAAAYHVDFAQALARPGVVAVALIRPGYTDREGRMSQGTHHGRIDSYTPATIAAVGNAIAALKRHYRAGRVVYVGHSGGAAIGGVLIGRRPGLIDAALLLSCPCNIPRWLSGHRRQQWQRSLSPSQFVLRVPMTTRVVAVTGAADVNTTPELARSYVQDLQSRGVPAEFQAIHGAGHGFSGLRSTALAAAQMLMQR